jgi:hypothetical protein
MAEGEMGKIRFVMIPFRLGTTSVVEMAVR